MLKTFDRSTKTTRTRVLPVLKRACGVRIVFTCAFTNRNPLGKPNSEQLYGAGDVVGGGAVREGGLNYSRNTFCCNAIVLQSFVHNKHKATYTIASFIYRHTLAGAKWLSLTGFSNNFHQFSIFSFACTDFLLLLTFITLWRVKIFCRFCLVFVHFFIHLLQIQWNSI